MYHEVTNKSIPSGNYFPQGKEIFWALTFRLLFGTLTAMEKLREYLNSLSVSEQTAYADKCGTSIGYLRKAICIGQKLDAGLARRLDEHSGSMVKREVLRPDVWA